MTLPLRPHPTVVQCRGMMDCGEDDKRLQARREKSEEKKRFSFVFLGQWFRMLAWIIIFKCNIEGE